jgi:hypothetical protein
MSEHCGDDEAYGVQHMKNRLKEHFGDKIIISEINGKQNVVTFRNTVHEQNPRLFKVSIRNLEEKL